MPRKDLPRYKEIKCSQCGKLIHRFDRSAYKGWHIPADVILSATRNHYKTEHPRKFKESIKRGVAKRQGL
jgi:phage FluMu protein Com